MHPCFTPNSKAPIRLWLFTQAGFRALKTQPFAGVKPLADAHGFTAAAGQIVCRMADDGAALSDVVAGLGKGDDKLALAAVSAKLPAGDYAIAETAGMNLPELAAGWADGVYRFERYLKTGSSAKTARLILPEGSDAEALSREAAAISRLRDLINTPAQDMGPVHLQGEISALAERFGAKVTAICGDALLAQNYPMIHAVGRAAAFEPRYIELEWGRAGDPKVALVGKGVTFDSGGLDLKPSDGMRIMKKDMGGAAHAIALAELIMSAGLKVHLTLHIPAVENAVSGNAFRPGDIVATRKGLSIEIDNTDAEGRLILCDALARACERAPDLLLDFATLTGAARTALGPDLAPLYTDDDQLAEDILAASKQTGDPVWRMPLWAPYLSDLSSPIADLANSGGKFAGSITAALFLKEFVSAKSWAHFDIWAWRQAKYGRPAGAAACGLRAVWAMLQIRYG